MSDCGTPVAFDKDSSSNTRSKFNAEGGEWSHAKDYLSVSMSKISERSLSGRGNLTPKNHSNFKKSGTKSIRDDNYSLNNMLVKKSVSPNNISSLSKS